MTFCVVFQCSSVGASFCYLLFYLVGRKLVQHYMPDRVNQWRGQVIFFNFLISEQEARNILCEMVDLVILGVHINFMISSLFEHRQIHQLIHF